LPENCAAPASPPPAMRKYRPGAPDSAAPSAPRRTGCTAVPPIRQSGALPAIGFIAYVFLYPNRVSLKEAFEVLELDDGKLSRPVLRGLGLSDGVRLLDPRYDPR